MNPWFTYWFLHYIYVYVGVAFSALVLLVGQQERHLAFKNWVVGCWCGCLRRGTNLHMAQLMPLPLTVSCFNKIQIGFTFLVPAHWGNPGWRAIKRVLLYICVCRISIPDWFSQSRVLGLRILALHSPGWVAGGHHLACKKLSGGLLTWLSVARCRFAYHPSDATATHFLLLQWNQDWFYLSGTGSPG